MAVHPKVSELVTTASWKLWLEKDLEDCDASLTVKNRQQHKTAVKKTHSLKNKKNPDFGGC